MTDPLIVVEGDLRLPPLRPLADPSLTFGREWSPMRNRPIRSLSEVPLYAARLHTEYAEALTMRDTSAPYRPMSIWGVVVDNPARQSMLRMTQAEAPAQPAVEQASPEPIPLSVRAPVRAPQKKLPFLSAPAKTAIALACAALLAWILFGREPHPVGEESAAPAQSTHQTAAVASVSTPASAAVTAVVASQPAAVASSAQPQPQPIDAPAPASSATVLASARAQPPADIAPRVAVARDIPASKSPSAHAVVAKVKPARIAKTQRVSAKKHASSGKARHRIVADHSGAYYDDYALSTRSGHYARGRTNYARTAEPTRAYARSRAAAPMNVESLYSLLQHSPTLDSNAAGHGSARGADAPANQAK